MLGTAEAASHARVSIMRRLAHRLRLIKTAHGRHLAARSQRARRWNSEWTHDLLQTPGIDRSAVAALKYDDLQDDRRLCVDTYLEFLLAENKKFNLTGMTRFDECVDQIVNDSTALIPLIESHFEESKDRLRVVDVGSGAGIPGVVFGILMQNWEVFCIEATEKKANFIMQAVERCGLENVHVLRGRSEEIAHDRRYRESFDVAVARGVGNLSVTCEYCLPFLKQHGLFVAPKGPIVEDEVSTAQSALAILGGSLKMISSVDSFGRLGQRKAVMIEKSSTSPRKYPRKPGIPAKRPL